MKEYRCDICNYSSNRFYNYTKHLRTKSHNLLQEKIINATESSKIKGNFSEKNGKKRKKPAQTTTLHGKKRKKSSTKVAQKAV